MEKQEIVEKHVNEKQATAEKKVSKAKQEVAEKQVNEKRTVSVFLPLLENEGSGAIDQSVSVTINGKTTTFQRGEQAEISIEAYKVLRESGRFPTLR